MSFFIRNNKSSSGNKRPLKGRKKAPTPKAQVPSKKKRVASDDDEEIASDSDFSANEDDKKEYSSSEEEEETPQEKRLRLAKQYLAQLKDQEEDQEEADEESHDLVARKLKEGVLEQAGKLQREVAQYYSSPDPSDVTLLKGHHLPVTAVVISSDDKYIYSTGKDCSIIQWSFKDRKKIKTIPGGRKGTEDKHIGHTACVLCLAVSSDNKYLVSGDYNKKIYVWDAQTLERLQIFTGHRDAVSGLAFRKGTHQLFSAAHDRSVKVWNLDEMAYVETLFGHQDIITGIDSLTRERAITAGGRDRSLRIWKIIEESQLVFTGHSGSVDCVSLINEEHFVSGADDNSLAVWTINKKKPLATLKNAHSKDDSPDQQENWVTAVVSLQHTDLVASGSKDGCIRLWRCANDFKKLEPVCSIPVLGFINSLKFTSDGQYLIAGVGQEHRLGRWWRLKEAKNGIYIIKLNVNIPDNAQTIKRTGMQKRKR